jgi:hypothetical protein
MILLQDGQPILRAISLIDNSTKDYTLTPIIMAGGFLYKYDFVYAFQQEILDYSQVITVNGIQIPLKKDKRALLGFWLHFIIDYSYCWDADVEQLGTIIDLMLTNNYKWILFPRSGDMSTYFEVVCTLSEIALRDLRDKLSMPLTTDGYNTGHFEGIKLNFKSATTLRELNWIRQQTVGAETTGEPPQVIGGQVST